MGRFSSAVSRHPLVASVGFGILQQWEWSSAPDFEQRIHHPLNSWLHIIKINFQHVIRQNISNISEKNRYLLNRSVWSSRWNTLNIFFLYLSHRTLISYQTIKLQPAAEMTRLKSVSLNTISITRIWDPQKINHKPNNMSWAIIHTYRETSPIICISNYFSSQSLNRASLHCFLQQWRHSAQHHELTINELVNKRHQ